MPQSESDVYRNGDPDAAATKRAVEDGVARVRRLWDRHVAGPPPFPNLEAEAPLSDEEANALVARVLERIKQER